jgi:Uma2 family endonuclease
VEYFENGARLVWVINPRQQYILVYRSSPTPDRLLKLADALTGEDVIPGFSLPVADLFQNLSF